MTDRGFLTAWLLLIIVMLFVHLGGYPLLDADEGRNGEVAREMAATNDYVMPRLDGLPYLDKPIVFFAAAAACMEVLGPTETAARLPALLFTLATAAVLAWFARRVGIDWRATAIVFLATPLTVAFSRTVIFDSALTLFITIAIVAFYEAVEDRRPGLSSIVAWAAMGFGVITKGPVALAVPLMIAVPYAIWRKRARFLVSISALIAFVVVVAPWVWAITRAVPDFLHYVLFTETAARLTSGALKRTGPPWYFIPFLVGGAFPWCFALVGERRAASGEREDWLARFLVLWIAVPFVFFSLSQSKRPQYVLPLMAPVALLVAWRWFDSRRASRATAIAATAFGILLLGAVPFVNLRFEYADTARFTAIGVGACALAGGVIALATRRNAIALAALTLPVIAIPLAANPLLNAIAIRRSTKALVAQLPRADEVIGLQAFSGSMAFYLQRPIILVSPNADEFTSNYLTRHYAQFASDSSTLRRFEWLPHAFDRGRTRLIIVRSNDSANRAIAERSGARLVATSARFVAYTMPH